MNRVPTKNLRLKLVFWRVYKGTISISIDLEQEIVAGRNNPDEAFKLAAKAMRPMDAVCVGIFSKDDPHMLEKDIALFEKYTVNA